MNRMRFIHNLTIMVVMICAVIPGPLPAQTRPEASRILFTNVHVFDGVSEERLENASVLVENNLIKAVSRDDLDAAGATVIDGGGRTLMPGLIDMHWHSAYANIAMQVGLNTDLAYHLLIGAKGNAWVTRRNNTIRKHSQKHFQTRGISAQLY